MHIQMKFNESIACIACVPLVSQIVQTRGIGVNVFTAGRAALNSIALLAIV